MSNIKTIDYQLSELEIELVKTALTELAMKHDLINQRIKDHGMSTAKTLSHSVPENCRYLIGQFWNNLGVRIKKIDGS
mgnify:FL=1